MATKPTVLPKFAEDDQVDPVSGEPNVAEPPPNRQDSGWNRREIPPRQWLNWLHRLTYRWILWAKEEIESLNSDAVLNTRRIDAGDGLQNGGDLSADRTISVDSTVARVETARVELGGDFDAGSFVRCVKIGNVVTISSDGRLDHANINLAESSAGAIPVPYRPTTPGANNIYSYSPNSVREVAVTPSGSLTTRLRSWDGSDSGVTGTNSEVFSITYVQDTT